MTFFQKIYILLALVVSATTRPQELPYHAIAARLAQLNAQYQNYLGNYRDPFSQALTVAETNTIYQTLLRRSAGFTCEETPLFKIQQALIHLSPEARAQQQVDTALLTEIITDSARLIAEESTPLHHLQSNGLALIKAQEYLARFNTPSPEEPHTTPTDQPQKKQKQQPPEHPEFDDTYNPFTKDLDNQDTGSDAQERSVIAQVNLRAPLFGQKIYSTIARGSTTALRTTVFENRETPPTGDSPQVLTSYPHGKQSYTLFLPSGYSPLQPLTEHAHIHPDGKGSYTLSLSRPQKSVDIPLRAQERTELSSYEREIYTQPVGFSAHEWPAPIQQLIHAYTRVTHHEGAIARAITQHIANHYLYSTKARSERDPIAALNAGAFQCDMAAYIMTSILRDAYQIPCRIIAGYPGKQAITAQKKSHSYLLLPAVGHTWVEVFHDGAWQAYDPTPRKKDHPEENEDKEQNTEFRDIPSSDGSNNKSDQQEILNQVQDDTATQEESKPDTQQIPPSGDITPYLPPELDDTLANLSLDEHKDTNPLRVYATILLALDALNPLRASDDALQKLSLAKVLIPHSTQEAQLFHTPPHETLPLWIKNTYFRAHIQEVNTTYGDCLRMLSLITLYTKVADTDATKTAAEQLAALLSQVLKLLRPLNHPRAQDMALVEDFKKSSPALVWKLMQQQYGIQEIVPNNEVELLAKDLHAGKHTDILLVNALYGHTNFILDASARAGSYEVKTWLRTQKRGRDLLPIQRVSDLPRALHTQNAAFVLAKRAKVKLPAPIQNTEAERITIVGFDTSGSMDGAPAEFQAALIAAFVSRALNDISPLGRPRHRVLLVPFDHEIHTPIKITSISEALDLIKNHQRILGNRGGGTDIQKFLLQAMQLIAEAQNTKNPFEIANIILMSDGESSLDYAELAKARQAIHRDTPLQTMFIALGQTNPELIQFARNAQKMGAAKEGLYRYFTEQEMRTIIARSKSIDKEKYARAFFSTESATKVSEHAIKKLEQALKQVTVLHDAITRVYATNRSELQELLAQQKAELPFADRPLELWIRELRQYIAKYKVFHDERLLNFMLQRIMQSFESITGVALRDLTHYELEPLKHLIQNPLGT